MGEDDWNFFAGQKEGRRRTQAEQNRAQQSRGYPRRRQWKKPPRETRDGIFVGGGGEGEEVDLGFLSFVFSLALGVLNLQYTLNGQQFNWLLKTVNLEKSISKCIRSFVF